MRKFASKLFIFLGICLYGCSVFLIYDRTNPRRVSFAYEKYQDTYVQKKEKIFPVKITIPKANIELPVIPAKILNNEWESTTEGVSYLTSSPVPGETGNSIMYGHNWTNLLGRLVMIMPGDYFEVTFNDNTVRRFDVEYTVTVTPDQTHILEASKDKRVTLYTCTGFLDSKRYVVVGILKDSK